MITKIEDKKFMTFTRVRIKFVKKIPLFDLSRQNKPLQKKILASWKKNYLKNEFTSGPETIEFEKNFAELCQTKYSLAVHSGTDSLIIALKASGISAGDEVITTPCTFSATADAIIHVGAMPIFADVDPETGNIDPDSISKKISKKTKAILIVHLYGVPCDLEKITKIAKKNNLILLEDASHAHGSLYENKPVGSFGLAGCFSLYPSKSLGALGNAGIIVSSNKEFIDKARMFANHGIKTPQTKYTHHLNGFNKLIDNLQSSALLHKLPLLPETISKKTELTHQYNQAFIKAGMKGMFLPKNTLPSIYVFAFQTSNREKIQKHFQKNDIETGVYYPTPLHLQPSFSFLGHKEGDFPHAELFFAQTLSLPIFAELKKSEIKRIIKAIETIPRA